MVCKECIFSILDYTKYVIKTSFPYFFLLKKWLLEYLNSHLVSHGLSLTAQA